jgi:hypothetical protein
MSLCTEDEARTKLCPFSFSSSGARQCVASECMAWHFVNRDEMRHGYCLLVHPPGTETLHDMIGQKSGSE